MNATLNTYQVEYLSTDILTECLVELRPLVELDKELEDYEELEIVILNKIKAILCTLKEGAYEDIVKVVRDKLNLNDLFDNRQKYLN